MTRRSVPECILVELGGFAIFGKIRNYQARGSPPKTRYCGHLNSRLMRIWSIWLVPNCPDYYVGEREWDTEEQGCIEQIECRYYGLLGHIIHVVQRATMQPYNDSLLVLLGFVMLVTSCLLGVFLSWGIVCFSILCLIPSSTGWGG